MDHEDQVQEVRRLKKLRDDCRNAGRLAQALLIDNVLWEIETGCDWLTYIRAEQEKTCAQTTDKKSL